MTDDELISCAENAERMFWARPDDFTAGIYEFDDRADGRAFVIAIHERGGFVGWIGDHACHWFAPKENE